MKAALRAEGVKPRGEIGSRGRREEAARRGDRVRGRCGRGQGGMQYVLLDLAFVTTMDEPALAELLVVRLPHDLRYTALRGAVSGALYTIPPSRT